MNYFKGNIEDVTYENSNFRKVIFTGKNLQLVVMSLVPGEDTGEEAVEEVDRFMRIESGQAMCQINKETHLLTSGMAIVVPAGAKHNITNSGKHELKLYTVYSPPLFPDNTSVPQHEHGQKIGQDSYEEETGDYTI